MGKKTVGVGKKTGRPTKYMGTDLAHVQRLYASGLTDDQVALALKVDRGTLRNWREAHPEFFTAVKDAKAQADEQVETALFNRATGATVKKTMMTPAGPVEYDDHLPPDPTSMIFWLKNRKPKEWRDKQELEHSGQVTTLVDLVRSAAQGKDGSDR